MKKPNKYNPQTCNRSGEAARRLRAIQRRSEQSIKRAQGWAKNNSTERV